MASPDNPCHRIASTDKCDLRAQTGKEVKSLTVEDTGIITMHKVAASRTSGQTNLHSQEIH